VTIVCHATRATVERLPATCLATRCVALPVSGAPLAGEVT